MRRRTDYGGGDDAALVELLAGDITWRVPGRNRIAGVYCGHGRGVGLLRSSRDLAGSRFRMHRKDILVGEGDLLAALIDGTPTIVGEVRQWATVGLYDVHRGRAHSGLPAGAARPARVRRDLVGLCTLSREPSRP
jgi:hypothetical protein